MSEGKIIEDKIYGEELIKDPVIIDLLTNSPSVQRLKRISQFGVPDKYHCFKGFSRYEHSVGVMMLLRKLDAPLEEQVAGLLHDVSHRAFSHVYDWVVEDRTQNKALELSQDLLHDDFIKNSELPEILLRHGLDPDRISDYHNFPLLEKDIPELCADRVDYSLREMPILIAHEIFYGLYVFNDTIVCRNRRIASKFGRAFLSLQTNHWGGFESVARFHYFS